MGLYLGHGMLCRHQPPAPPSAPRTATSKDLSKSSARGGRARHTGRARRADRKTGPRPPPLRASRPRLIGAWPSSRVCLSVLSKPTEFSATLQAAHDQAERLASPACIDANYAGLGARRRESLQRREGGCRSRHRFARSCMSMYV